MTAPTQPVSARDVIAGVDGLQGWDIGLTAADAILAALRAAGLAVVPVEPTKAMKNAAWMHVTIGLENGWDSTMHDLLKAAMLAAASESDDGSPIPPDDLELAAAREQEKRQC